MVNLIRSGRNEFKPATPAQHLGIARELDWYADHMQNHEEHRLAEGIRAAAEDHRQAAALAEAKRG